MKKKEPIREIIEKAWLSGAIYTEIPCSGHARNMVNRFRNKHGFVAHSHRMGRVIGVFFHDRIKAVQEENNKMALSQKEQ